MFNKTRLSNMNVLTLGKLQGVMAFILLWFFLTPILGIAAPTTPTKKVESRLNITEALKTHRRATKATPKSPEAWNELGLLLERVGDLKRAIRAYSTVLTLSKKQKNKQYIIIANGNLGHIYQRQGRLKQAIESYTYALTASKKMGSIEIKANIYSNLGEIYKAQGKLNKAIEAYKQSLKIEKILDHQAGMASDYANLGLIYKQKGQKKQAKNYWNLSLKLFKKLRSPQANKVKQLLKRIK